MELHRRCTAADVLSVINRINANLAQGGEGEFSGADFVRFAAPMQVSVW
jgi:hypothetical protein